MPILTAEIARAIATRTPPLLVGRAKSRLISRRLPRPPLFPLPSACLLQRPQEPRHNEGRRDTHLKKSFLQKSFPSRLKHLSVSAPPQSEQRTHSACHVLSSTVTRNLPVMGFWQPAQHTIIFLVFRDGRAARNAKHSSQRQSAPSRTQNPSECHGRSAAQYTVPSWQTARGTLGKGLRSAEATTRGRSPAQAPPPVP